MVQACRVEPYAIEIMVVFEDIHGVVGNIDDAVVVVVALLHARRAYANYFKRDTINADGLADCGHAREELVTRFRRNDGIETVLHVIRVVEKTSLLDVEVPYVLNRWVETHHRKGKGAIIVLDGGIFLQHADDVAAEWNVFAQQFDIVVGQSNLDARLIASGLLGRAPRENSDGGGAEAFKDGLDRLAEAVAVGEKQDDSCDAPRHAGHGEQGAAQVVAHGRVRLLKEVAVHLESHS